MDPPGTIKLERLEELVVLVVVVMELLVEMLQVEQRILVVEGEELLMAAPPDQVVPVSLSLLIHHNLIFP